MQSSLMERDDEKFLCAYAYNEVVNAWNDTWVGGGVIEELSFLKLCCETRRHRCDTSAEANSYE